MTFAKAGQWGPEALIDAGGDPIAPGAVLTLRTTGGAVAVRYLDEGRAATGANPWTYGGGNLKFFADPDDYELTVTIGGVDSVLDVSVPPDPDDLVSVTDFPVLIRTNYEEISVRFVHGGLGATADDFATAASEVRPGGKVVVPPDVYEFEQDPSTLMCVPLSKRVIFEGSGAKEDCVIRMADGTGDFVAMFGAATPSDTSASGTKLRHLTLDCNLPHNVPALGEPSLQHTAPGGWQTRRNGLAAGAGEGYLVEDCLFIDFPRQCVFMPGDTNDELRDSHVRHCTSKVTMLNPYTDPKTGMWDVTCFLLRGGDCSVSQSVLIGGPGLDYFISRTPVQVSGSGARVWGNVIRRMYRTILCGNPGLQDVAKSIAVFGNEFYDVLEHVEIQSLWWSGWAESMGGGVQTIEVCSNPAVFADRSLGWGLAGTTDAGMPAGIKYRSDNSLACEDVNIHDNPMKFPAAYTGGGGPAVNLAIDAFDDAGKTVPHVVHGTSRNIRVKVGPVENCGQSAFSVRGPQTIETLTVEVDGVTNPANRAGAPDSQRAVVRIGDASGSDDDGGALIIRGLRVIVGQWADTRAGGHLVSAQAYVDCDTLTGAVLRPATAPNVADGAVVPVVTEVGNSRVIVNGAEPYVRTLTVSRSAAVSDLGCVLAYAGSGPITYTVPLLSTAFPMPTGAGIEIQQRAAGHVTIAGAAGVTIINEASAFKTAAAGTAVRLFNEGGNVWLLTGRAVP